MPRKLEITCCGYCSLVDAIFGAHLPPWGIAALSFQDIRLSERLLLPRQSKRMPEPFQSITGQMLRA